MREQSDDAAAVWRMRARRPRAVECATYVAR